MDAVVGGADVSCACAVGGGGTKDNNDKTCACVPRAHGDVHFRRRPRAALHSPERHGYSGGVPLIPEIGLARCITDSRYMRLIDTRATEVLRHNPECAGCEHALQCLAGCRASALETTPDDILGIDKAACALFKGGWVEKIRETAAKVNPQLRCRV